MADATGQIAAEAVTHTVYFGTFKFLRLLFIFNGSAKWLNIVLFNRQMKTPMLLYLKGLHAHFCFCSTRNQIPFCSMQKGISYHLQNQKICKNKSVLHCKKSLQSGLIPTSGYAGPIQPGAEKSFRHP